MTDIHGTLQYQPAESVKEEPAPEKAYAKKETIPINMYMTDVHGALKYQPGESVKKEPAPEKDDAKKGFNFIGMTEIRGAARYQPGVCQRGTCP
jgi:hypothetical protein